MPKDLPPQVDLKAKPGSSNDEAGLLERLNDLQREGETAKARWVKDSDIERALALYRGDVKTSSGEAPEFFEGNFIESFIESMVAQLTDNRPIMRVEHRKLGLHDAATATGKAVRASWDESRMQRQLFHLAYLAAVTGSSGLYMGWDFEEQNVAPEILSLKQVVCSPEVREAALMDRAEYVIIQRIATIDALRETFGARGGLVEPDATAFPPDEERSKSVLSPITAFLKKGKGPSKRSDAVDRARVYEALVQDRQKGADGQRLFPFYRRIVWAGDVILWDKPMPFWDGRIPLDWYDWRIDPEHPWGVSEPKRLQRIQLAFNQLINETTANAIITNVISIIGDHDAVTEKQWQQLQKLGRTLVLRKQNRNASVNIIPAPPFGLDRVQLAKQLFTFAQLLTGVTDIVLGEVPGSLQSGQAVEGLQEGANLKTRSRASRMEDLMIRAGQKLIARILQYVPSDRVFSWLGPTGEAFAFAFAKQELFVKSPDEEIKLAADGSVVPGQFVPLDTMRKTLRERPLREKQVILKYLRFAVVPGSSAPGSRLNRAKLLTQLMKLGAAGRQHVLEAADFSEPEEMIRQASEDAANNPILQAQTRRRTDADPFAT